jgi:radical SAM protein with 4Fe4S-binding SPASM domain
MMTDSRQVTLDLDKVLDDPGEFTVVPINGRHLVFFYLKPNWVALDGQELAILKLVSSKTIAQLLALTSKASLSSLLVKLYSRGILATPHQQKRQAGPATLPMHVYLTNACNLRCAHCYMNAGKRLRHELGLGEWKSLLDEFIAMGGRKLSISGGEPLCVDFLPDLLRFAKLRQPKLRIKLLTNGTMLDKLPVCFYNQHVDELQVSIDGPTAETHDAVRGRGSFQRTINNLRFLAAFSGRVTISMCVLDQHVDTFAENFRQFRRAVIRLLPKARFGIATDLMDGRQYARLPYTKARENLAKVSHSVDSCFRGRGKMRNEEKSFERNARTISCGFGGTITITADGVVYPCGVVFGPGLGMWGEKTMRQYAEECRNIIQQFSVDATPACSECLLRYVCGGTCRIVNKKVRGDYQLPTCTEAAKDDLYLAMFEDDIEFDGYIERR